MTTKLERTMSMAVNVAILLVAACVIFLVARNEIDRRHEAANGALIAKGQTIDLPGGPAPASQRIAVIALQIGCHFCHESLPFYRQLVADAVKTNTHLVFVFPNPLEQARSYLADNGVAATDVRQVSLRSLHVTATPTILLLAPGHRVQNFWVGKLPSDKEAQVERAIE